MELSRRHVTYFALRGVAAVGFLVCALVLPHGAPAAAACMAFGLLAVLTCFGTNAGASGEQAGARAQQRAYDRLRAPQGSWPPYDDALVVRGELVED